MTPELFSEALVIDPLLERKVIDNIMANDGGPIMTWQVRKTMRALIRLGLDGWT